MCSRTICDTAKAAARTWAPFLKSPEAVLRTMVEATTGAGEKLSPFALELLAEQAYTVFQQAHQRAT